MEVLSLLQPWASLVVIGAKKIETRSWNTKYRGPLLIHASKSSKRCLGMNNISFKEPFYSELKKAGFIGGKEEHKCGLPLGAIIGSVNLIDTSDTETINAFNYAWGSYIITDNEKLFGDYSPGRYGWLLSDAVQFAQPIPAKGSLGIWNYDMPDHIHVPNKYGGHATFDTPPTKELLDAVNEMADLAYKMVKK